MRRVLWVVASIVAGCGGGGGGENAQAALTVVFVEPSDGSTAVGPDSSIRVEFNLALDPATIDDTTFVVEGPVGPVEGTRATDGGTATFVPARRLGLAAEYEVRLHSEVRSTKGIRLGASHATRFATRDGIWKPTESLPYNIDSPRVVADSEGNAMVVWIHESDIFYREYRVGSGWGTLGLIRVGAPYGRNLSLTSTPDGNCLAAWLEYHGTSTSPVWQVHISHFIPGAGWDNPSPILSSSETSGEMVAMDAAGRAVVVTDFQGYLLARVYQPVAGWEDPQILTPEPRSHYDLRVRMDAAGSAHVVWCQSVSGQGQIVHVRYKAASGWSVPEVIHSTASDTHPPQLAVGPSGSAIVVWAQGSPGTYRVYFNRYNPQGGWTGSRRTHPSDQADAMRPAIAGDPEGRLIMAVSRDNHVWSSTYTPTTGWETAVPMQLQSESIEPHIALDAGGNAVAVWSQKISLYQYDLWSSRWTPSGGWGLPTVLETAPGLVLGDIGQHPGVAISGTGAATVVWNEYAWQSGSGMALFKRFD